MKQASAWTGIQAESEIESSAPIAIPINVLEFRDDGDDRGDSGRVAVGDDQLRSLDDPCRSYSVQNPRLLLQIGKQIHQEPQRRRIAYRSISSARYVH